MTQAGEVLLAGWVKIAPDGTTTVYVPHVDMGQGVHTALAMMLAEEMDADWSKVRTEQAPGDEYYANRFLARGFVVGDRHVPQLFDGVVDGTFGALARLTNLQITGGSMGVRFTGQIGMRTTGAMARQMLLNAAAARLQVPAASLSTRDGVVVHAANGQMLPFGSLVAEAAALPMPDAPALKKPREFRLIGTSLPRLDIPRKVDGSLAYGIDVAMPGMLYAAVVSTPVQGEALISFDDGPARALPGVEKIVRLSDGAAVIARDYWTAQRATALLRPVFADAGSRKLSTESLRSAQAQALNTGEFEERLKRGDSDIRGAKRLEATYRVPFLHHATMEPMNFCGRIAADGTAEFWGGVQNRLWTRKELAKLCGLDLENVVLHAYPLGGSFGRRSVPEVANYLPMMVELAKAASPNPVKMIWSREQDFIQGAYRAALASTIRAELDDQGRPLLWHQRFVDSPERNDALELPYSIPNQLMESVKVPHHVRTGPWRSVGHTQHGFYAEVFMDELAAAAGRDPFEYRRDLLAPGSREQKVLALAAQRAGWGAPTLSGRGRGIALVCSFGSIAAHVVECSVGDQGPRVHRVTVVVDCGSVVHPDTALQQVQGSVIMGLSAALGEQITLSEGAVVQRGFAQYPVLRMADTPDEIDVHFVTSGSPLGGLGEPAVPGVAPALVNAIYAATGRRIRDLPVAAAIRELKV